MQPYFYSGLLFKFYSGLLSKIDSILSITSSVNLSFISAAFMFSFTCSTLLAPVIMY